MGLINIVLSKLSYLYLKKIREISKEFELKKGMDQKETVMRDYWNNLRGLYEWNPVHAGAQEYFMDTLIWNSIYYLNDLRMVNSQFFKNKAEDYIHSDHNPQQTSDEVDRLLGRNQDGD